MSFHVTIKLSLFLRISNLAITLIRPCYGPALSYLCICEALWSTQSYNLVQMYLPVKLLIIMLLDLAGYLDIYMAMLCKHATTCHWVTTTQTHSWQVARREWAHQKAILQQSVLELGTGLAGNFQVRLERTLPVVWTLYFPSKETKEAPNWTLPGGSSPDQNLN